MNRFLVFCGENYYPSGGWKDYRTNCETLQEAEACARGWTDDEIFHWAHIVDTLLEMVVSEFHYLEKE